jgi:hypothetical protein
MDLLGHPLPERTKKALDKASKETDDAALVRGVQDALDPFCLLTVNINPESRVKVAAGPAKAELVEQGWRQFLVKVHNESGVTAELKALSPQALKLAESPASARRSSPSMSARVRKISASATRSIWYSIASRRRT